MDTTVRLWNLKSKECIKVFEHPDVVTGVDIHPKDEDLFITGCLDNQLRIWSLRDKKVLRSATVDSVFITTVSFTQDGNQLLAGSHDGQCFFFNTDVRTLLKDLH